MIRLFSPPGILTGLVVVASVVTGFAFGATVASTALLAGTISRRVRR